MDEHVLRGNAAIIKCHIPSFVAEFVQVDSWLEDDATEIYPGRDYGTHVQHMLDTVSLFFCHTIMYLLTFYRLALSRLPCDAALFSEQNYIRRNRSSLRDSDYVHNNLRFFSKST